MKKIKVAIAGANGFLGTHLVSTLRQKKNFQLSLFDFKKHSLFKTETLKNFLSDKEAIIHLAGANRDSNYNLVKVNTLGTLGLLEAASQYSPKAKVIFSSSFQAYSASSIYGLSKKFAEDLIKSYSQNSPLKGIIFRIANIYGPGAKPFYNSVIATFIQQIKKDEPLTINGDGKQKRDYVYVEDVVTAIIKAVFYEPKEEVETFNLCSSKLTSLNEIIKILKEFSPKKIRVRYNKGYQGFEWSIKKDYQKTAKYLDWQPKVTIKKGLEKTLKAS